MYKVSVIIPIYNVKKFVGKCFESLVHQTLDNYEIIAVNDGSTDDSLDVIKKYKKIYPNLITIIDQPNMGVSIARNNGVADSKGEYIAFVDGDDYVGYDYLEKLYNHAVLKKSDMVFCGHKEVDTFGRILSEKSIKDYFNPKIIAYKYMIIWSKLIKKELLVNYNIKFLDGVRGEDIPFVMKINEYAKNISFIEYSDYFYVQHGTSITKKMVRLPNNISLPVNEIKDSYFDIKKHFPDKQMPYLEVSIARSFAYFLYVFGKKSKKENLYNLVDNLQIILNEMKLSFNEVKLLVPKEYPLKDRIASWVFVKSIKIGKLKEISYLVTRF